LKTVKALGTEWAFQAVIEPWLTESSLLLLTGYTMDRNDVVELIAKHLAEEIDHVQVDDIEAEMTMRDIGANSLDMIEVVSAVMRDLDIKVPRAQLADIDTVGGLADEFLEHVD